MLFVFILPGAVFLPLSDLVTDTPAFLDLTPTGRYKNKREIYYTRRKQDKERRVYTKEFKAEAAALAGKHEKPVRQIAQDLGVNENQLCRWIQQAREAAAAILILPIRDIA